MKSPHFGVFLQRILVIIRGAGKIGRIFWILSCISPCLHSNILDPELHFTMPCSLLLTPCSLLLAPYSLLLAPCSLLLAPCSLLLAPTILRWASPGHSVTRAFSQLGIQSPGHPVTWSPCHLSTLSPWHWLTFTHSHLAG